MSKFGRDYKMGALFVVIGAVLGGGLSAGGYGVKKGIQAYNKLTPQQKQAGFLKLDEVLGNKKKTGFNILNKVDLLARKYEISII